MTNPKIWMLSTAVLILVFGSLLAADFGGITGRYLERGETDETARVDLFAMSMCSFCVEIEPVLGDVLDHLDDNVRFRLFFVAEEDGEGGFTSLHGQNELEEDARQLCIFEHYPGIIFNYQECMLLDGKWKDPGDNWKGCAENLGMEPSVIEDCWTGEEAPVLLSENVKKAKYMKIRESPVILINQRRYTGERTAEALKSWICDEFGNPPEECSLDLGEGGLTGMIIGTPAKGTCPLEN